MSDKKYVLRIIPGGVVMVYHPDAGYAASGEEPLKLSEGEACRMLLTHGELVRTLARILDGLDSNNTGYGEGLSMAQWDARVKDARAALDAAEGAKL